jgi:tetratricopeptide (TPR) repeat protein
MNNRNQSGHSIVYSQLLLGVAVVGALLASIALVYWPGLSGPLLLDDFANLHDLKLVERYGGWEGVGHYLAANRSGVLGRPVSMLSFLLDDFTWPVIAIEFKKTNLLLHAATAATMFLLLLNIQRLMGAAPQRALWIALAAALLWGIHPINISTTLYIVQRMAILATFFSLWAILFFIWGRDRWANGASLSGILLLLASSAAVGLAVLSKENGILAVGLILLVDGIFYRDTRAPVLYKAWKILFLWGVVAALLFHFSTTWQSIVAGYDVRGFTLGERLWSEGRMLWSYLGMMANPLTVKTSLYADDVVISHGPFDPVTSLLAWLGVAAAVAGAWYLRRAYPLFVFAVGWFLIAHSIESSFIPLEIVFEHRNYLPSIGVFFAAAYGVAGLLRRIERLRSRQLATVGAWTLIGLIALIAHERTAWWGNQNALQALWALQSPRSIRAQSDWALQLAVNERPEQALTVMGNLAGLYPDDLAVNIDRDYLACKFGHVPGIDWQRYTEGSWQVRRVTMVYAMTNLMELAHGNFCDPVSPELVSKIFERLLVEPVIVADSRSQAKLMYMYGNHLFAAGNRQGAMERLDEAATLQKTVDIPLRQAVMLNQVGDYQGALRYLDRAEVVDKDRPSRQPSRMAEITEMRAAVEALSAQ